MEAPDWHTYGNLRQRQQCLSGTKARGQVPFATTYNLCERNESEGAFVALAFRGKAGSNLANRGSFAGKTGDTPAS